MKLFDKGLNDSKLMPWLFLAIVLFAPVLVVQAQDLKDAPGEDSQFASNLPADGRQIANKPRWLALEPPVERHNASPQQTAPAQSNANSGYVFPTKDERLKRYVRNIFGPVSLISIGVAAGFDQYKDKPEEWGQGASGYGKRYASRFGQDVIKQTVSYGLSEALRLDTGFQRSTRKGFGPRLKDALLYNVTSRTRSGKRVLSAPRLAGAYAGGIIPVVTWYPSRYDYKDGLRRGTTSLAMGFGINVLREFIFPR